MMPTAAGVIMGTPCYMSPEQARGLSVDKRADVWAFGCLVYEMLAGHRAFQRETVADTLSAILEHPVDWHQLPANTTKIVLHLLRRCLTKDTDRRMRDIREARIEIEEVLTRLDGRRGASQQIDPGELVADSGVPAEYRTRRELVYRLGVIAVAISAALAVVYLRYWSESSGSVPAVVNTLQLTADPAAEDYPSFSPDGTVVVYAGNREGRWDIYSQRIDGGEPFNLTARREAPSGHPALSPDGQQIAFRSGGQPSAVGIYVMGATGENPRRLTDFGVEPAWSPDGTQLVFSGEPWGWPMSSDPRELGSSHPLWVIDVATEQVRQLGDNPAGTPRWSPNGHRIAYWGTVQSQRDIHTIGAEGGDPVPVTNDPAVECCPVWSPDGRFLYYSSNRGGSSAVWRVPIDEESGAVTGEPVAITAGEFPLKVRLTVSQDGQRIAYASRDTRSNLGYVPFDPETGQVGAFEPITHGARLSGWHDLDVSPDGEWLVYIEGWPREDLYLVRTDGTGQFRLTDDWAKDRRPAFAPDGTQVAWDSNTDDTRQIWAINVDGGGRRQLTFGGDGSRVYPSFSADGRQLAYWDTGRIAIIDPSMGWDDQEAQFLPLGPNGELVTEPTWLPDGRLAVRWNYSAVGEAALAVFDFDTERYEVFSEAPGAQFLAPFLNHPFILSRATTPSDTEDGYSSSIRLLNLETGLGQDLLPADGADISNEPGTYGIYPHPSPDGKRIYIENWEHDSNIWVIELANR